MPFTVSSKAAVRGRATSFTFLITASGENAQDSTEEYIVNDAAVVSFQFQYCIASGLLFISVEHKKVDLLVDSTVKMVISCVGDKLLSRNELLINCSVEHTLIIGDVKIPLNEVYLLKVDIIVSKTKYITFKSVYNDMVLTDFYLSTKEGRVAVHKVCLAMHSVTFKTMLQNKWKETEDGCIEMKDFTLQTLQHLKDYIYLRKLPGNLEYLGSLLRLAKCYFMENLKEDCLMKLATKLSSENLYEYQEYAVDNNIPELSRMLLELATDELVNNAQKCKNSDKSDKNSNESESD